MNDRETMPVDEFDLELALAGAELSPERRAAVEAAEGLAPARDEIAQLGAWWGAHAPPLAVPPPAQRRSRAWAWAAVAAAAAVALLAVWITPGPSTEFQPRGEVTLDWVATRGGAPLTPEEPILPGDALSLALVADQAGRFHLASLQDDGGVTVLVHDHRVAAGQRFVTPGRVVLDAYDGREWLVLMQTRGDVDPAALEDEVRALLPDPARSAGAHAWVVEVTRGAPSGPGSSPGGPQ